MRSLPNSYFSPAIDVYKRQAGHKLPAPVVRVVVDGFLIRRGSEFQPDGELRRFPVFGQRVGRSGAGTAPSAEGEHVALFAADHNFLLDFLCRCDGTCNFQSLCAARKLRDGDNGRRCPVGPVRCPL